MLYALVQVSNMASLGKGSAVLWMEAARFVVTYPFWSKFIDG